MKKLVDTNIWVYSYDGRFPEKQKLARSMIDQIRIDGLAHTSAQVLNEIFSVFSNKLGFNREVALAVVEDIAQLPCENTDFALVRSAIEIGASHQINHWDALLVAAALRGGCGELITEDLQHGQVIEGVRVVNPFLEGE